MNETPGNKATAQQLPGEPFDLDAWFAKLGDYRDIPFMPEGRQQPPMPPLRKIFEDK
jgi:hypothetical protein